MIIANKKHTMFGGVLYEAASFLAWAALFCMVMTMITGCKRK